MKRSILLSLLIVAAVAAPASAQDRINVKIIGGNIAAPGQFPWMATLVLSGEKKAADGFFCGGSVIAPRVVLTAAHCTEGKAAEDMDVIVGRTRISNETAGQRVGVSAVVTHPEWDTNTVANDLVLLQLAEPVQVPPIGLPRPQDLGRERPPSRLVVSGWGLTSEGGRGSNDLRYVRLTMRASTPCARRYPDYTGKTQLCAGDPAGGEDSCQGDSGGPLFSGDGATARVHGIVSYGEGCARKNVPGVYTRVSGFTQWIVDNMTNLNGDAPPPPPAVDPPVVSIGAIRCGAVFCNVALRVKGRAPAGGILVNAARSRTKKRKAVDRSVFARQVSPGRWTARINLPVGRISLYAFPLDAKRELLDGEGDAEKFIITVG